MKPVLVLLGSFIIAVFATKLLYKEYNFLLSGRIALASMLMFTAIGHFAYTKGMAMMIPKPIPYKKGIIYLTGVLEIVLAISLLIPKLRVLSGWVFIIFLLSVLPANIYASLKHLDFEKETFTGNGMAYLWLRIPLQFLFIAWTYICCIKF